MILNNSNPSDRREYPSRWPMVRGKNLFRTVDVRSIDGNEELLTVSHITGITPRKSKNVTMFMAESLVGYKKVLPDDIAANTMWMWQGAIGVSKYNGVISPSYNVYRQKKKVYESAYLDYLLREQHLVEVYHSLSTGIRPSRLRLYPEQLFSIDFPVPPLDEQIQIVKYIGWKTSMLNGAIKMLRSQVKLLHEAKELLLYTVITKGLSKISKQKDSGEPTIGMIPETWKCCQIKYIARLYNGNSISDSEKENYTAKTDIPYIATKDVSLATCTADYENGLYVRENSGFKIAPAGCTLVCIEGGSAGKKKAYIDRPVAFVNKLCAFLPTDINGRFLFYYLCSPAFMLQFGRNVTGLIGGVTINTIKRLLIPVPSITEQDEIVAYLDSECGKIDEQVAYLNKQIELLHEMSKRIISDTITGKIDVRGVEIPEYEYTEEDAAADSDLESDESYEEVDNDG